MLKDLKKMIFKELKENIVTVTTQIRQLYK